MAPEYCTSAYAETENGRGIINCRISGDTCVKYSQEKAPPGCPHYLMPKYTFSNEKDSEESKEDSEESEESESLASDQDLEKTLKVKIPLDDSLEQRVKIPLKRPIRAPQDSYA